jgi:hypothetical protein
MVGGFFRKGRTFGMILLDMARRVRIDPLLNLSFSLRASWHAFCSLAA